MTTQDEALTILFDALGDDELIRRAIRVTALKALSRANEMLDRGSPATRTVVIRSIMPALVKTLEKREIDDELAELKEQLTALMTEVREGAPKELPEVVPQEVLTDDPRPAT